jgi:tetratricopeptide (TPR) repeat protein
VQAIKAEAVHFNGIQPGGSTRDELTDKWGPPKELKKTGATTRYIYAVDPFEQVIVSVHGDRVAGIAIYLKKPLASRPLAEQLQLDDCQPIIIADAQGKPLGEGFPEHGVMFAFSSSMGAGHAQQIVLEPIDAQAFLLRAESRIKPLPAHALADAEYASQLDPKIPAAHALQAQALERLGRPGAACVAAEEAMRLDPKRKDLRFLVARLEIESGNHQAAARIMQRMLTQQPLPPLMEARAYQLWGDCLSQPRDNDFSQAIEHHQHAIRLAEPLAGDRSPATSRAAKILLVEAHMAVARDIALGSWAHKNQAALKWLGRARMMAEELTSKDEVDETLLLKVYETAMLVLAAAPGKTPAADWIAGLKRLGAERIAAADEAAYRGAIQWRLGLALADAVAIERAAGRDSDALRLGEEAAKLLADAETTIDTPDRDARAGMLYYRLGALEAIERGNHRAAVAWYDKALPLIQSAPAVKAAKAAKAASAADLERHGDMLVSMAVSYWETGAKEQAVRLSQQGAKSIEDAVDAGSVPRTALAVPYSNLASMLSQQGDATLAGHYAELAARVESTLRK